jgi:hypothetical protein
VEIITIPDSPVKVKKAEVRQPCPQFPIIIDDSPIKKELPILEKDGNRFDGNPVKPMLFLGKRTLTSDQIISLLFCPDPHMVCSKQPLKVQKNCEFLVDLRHISLEDLRADGNPPYDKYGGFRKKNIRVEKNKDGGYVLSNVSSKAETITRNDQYVLNRIYHTKTFEDENDFHRKIIYVSDHSGNIVNNVALVQYSFEHEEVAFDLQPHGNSKKGRGARGFTRTQPSTLATLKEKCATLGPREAVRQTKASCGGVTMVESSNQMPRGVNQAKYIRKKMASAQQQFGGENSDEVLAVLVRMKEEDNSFIRDVSIGKDGISVVLASDVQLAELETFCTDEAMFTVMQIDPTFNLGPYECTPISYRNLLLERKSTGKPPIFVGPVLLHYKKDERTFKDFLNKLKSLRPGLKDIISVGTDGEKALINALQDCLAKASERSLRCFRHFRQNVEDMLSRAGIKGASATQYVWEIFGKAATDGSYETGLLDSDSEDEFDAMLASLKPVWESRENGSKAFDYVKQRSEMMKKNMIAKVRREAGLISMSASVDVPVKFYTLEAESTNNRIKAKKKRRASGFMGTIEAIRSIDEEQQEDFALAVAGLHEDLRLREEFAKFQRPDFLELSTRERKKFISKLRSTRVSKLLTEDLSSILSANLSRTAGERLEPGDERCTLPLQGLGIQTTPEDTDESLDHLAISDDDERLSNLPAFTRQGILRKANLILRDKSVYEGPSMKKENKRWYSVGSFSSDKPHQVAVKEVDGEVCCDCEGWRAQKFCAHAVAVSQYIGMLSSYLDWYSKKQDGRNVTNIVNMNVKKQSLGRKAKDKLPRDRKRKAEPTVLVKTKTRRKSFPKDRNEHHRYRLLCLSETTAYKCYGCDSAMRCPPAVPPSPDNLTLTTMEYRSFLRDGKLQVKYQRTYYHVSQACVLKKNDNFSSAAIFLKDCPQLDTKQKQKLKKEFGLEI